MRARWILLAGVIGLVATGLLEVARPTAAAPVTSATSAAHARPARAGSPSFKGDPATATAERGGDLAGKPLPPSLEGTDVDGSLSVDAEGHLVVGPAVIALFDYFFSASGEEPDSVLRGRIAAYARGHLEEPALGEALDLLDRHAAYREAGRALPSMASASPRERLRAIHELRERHFGEDAEALFGDEERKAMAAIARRDAVTDERLSPEERADRLAEVDEGLPAAERAARAQTVIVAQFRADEAALRAAGADEAEVRRFRTGTLGEDATARLEALDRERAAWKERLDTFRREREQRCHGAGDTACETALLQASFDAREQIRVRAVLSLP